MTEGPRRTGRTAESRPKRLASLREADWDRTARASGGTAAAAVRRAAAARARETVLRDRPLGMTP